MIPYAQFRTGLTYRDVYEMLWSPDEDRATWRHKSRGVVLGKWHQIKREMYDAACAAEARAALPCDADCFCDECTRPLPAPVRKCPARRPRVSSASVRRSPPRIRKVPPMRKPVLPPHYAALLNVAKTSNLPSHFLTDLTKWDCLALEARDVRLPFVWGIHVHGTYLVLPESRPQGEGRVQSSAAPLVRWVEDANGPGRVQWYCWDGSRLIALPALAAQEFLLACAANASVGRAHCLAPGEFYRRGQCYCRNCSVDVEARL